MPTYPSNVLWMAVFCWLPLASSFLIGGGDEGRSPSPGPRRASHCPQDNHPACSSGVTRCSIAQRLHVGVMTGLPGTRCHLTLPASCDRRRGQEPPPRSLRPVALQPHGPLVRPQLAQYQQWRATVGIGQSSQKRLPRSCYRECIVGNTSMQSLS